MGVICSIYLVSDEEFNNVPKSDEQIEIFLEENSPLMQDERGVYYFQNRYDTDKAWNPTFELLNNIAASNSPLFRNPDDEINDTDIFYQNSKRVAYIAEKLSNLNEEILSKHLSNKEFTGVIKLKKGYGMECIDFPNLIIEHFEIIKSAYKDAFKKGMGVVMTLG